MSLQTDKYSQYATISECIGWKCWNDKNENKYCTIIDEINHITGILSKSAQILTNYEFKNVHIFTVQKREKRVLIASTIHRPAVKNNENNMK